MFDDLRTTTLRFAIWLRLTLPMWCLLAATTFSLHAADDAAFVSVRDSVRAFGLPVMMVQTVNEEEPTCDYVSCPPGSMGGSITNVTKVPARMRLYDGGYDDADDALLYDSGIYRPDTSGITIKIRGNTSAYQAKKPYKIKLQKKADLLLRSNDKKYKDKNWVLICDDDLCSLFGFTVSKIVGMTWTPAFSYVNLVVNGNYRGIYMLLEQVKRNNDCRLACDKDGFIMEEDAYWWNNQPYIRSNRWHPSYGYTFKYPEEDEFTEEQLAYITSCLNAYDAAVMAGTYYTEVDVASFARWQLAHDILGTWDSGGSNKYYLKRDNTDQTKLEMPCLWDLGTSMQMTDAWSRLHSLDYHFLFSNKKNKDLIKVYQRQWNRLSGSLAAAVMTQIDDFVASPVGVGYGQSRPHDNTRWGRVYGSINDQRNRINDWITRRVEWMNPKVAALYKNPCKPSDVNEDRKTDIADLDLVINEILGWSPHLLLADVNGDNVVDISDVQEIINDIIN